MFQRVAIVPYREGDVPLADLMRVAAAIDKQVQRDLRPIWGNIRSIAAFVSAYASLSDAPVEAWPVVVAADIRRAAGFHSDEFGQPFALVEYRPGWELTVSHEVLEMLVDPFGNLLQESDAVDGSGGRSSFLVEVCDPCESVECSYSVDGVTVSDFYTPHYFDPVKSSGVRYSFAGNISEPKQVLKGGYLSWRDPSRNTWFQKQFFIGNEPQIVPIGVSTTAGGSIRSQIDRITLTQQAFNPDDAYVKGVLEESKKKQIAYTAQQSKRAKRVMKSIAKIIKSTKPPSSRRKKVRKKPSSRR